MRPKAAVASGVSVDSLPPVDDRVGVAVARSSASAVPIACAPAAQADTVPNDWPRRSCLIDTTPDAAFAISSGIDSGETVLGALRRAARCAAPRACRCRRCRCRSRSRRASGSIGGLPSSQRASSSASAAAVSASCVKRSERRTSLTERCSLGSKSLQRPKPSSMPDWPGAPALVQGAGADAERRDGAHSRDDDGAAHDSFASTRSTAWPTVVTPFMSSPLSCTP